LNRSATLPPVTPNTIRASNDTSEGRARNRRLDNRYPESACAGTSHRRATFATDNSNSGGSTL